MNTETHESHGAVAGQVDCDVRPLVERLNDEADLCRNEGADDIAALLDEAVEELQGLDQARRTYFAERNSARDALRRRQRRAEQLQGGMSNAELLAAWKQKLPGVEPTDRELTSFALGVEVGCGRVA
jgi:hypothetical protein